MLRVIAYTGGHNNPARVPRVQQYIPALKPLGVEVTESASRAGSYPPHGGFCRRAAWGLWNLAEHLPAIGQSYGYDVTLLQREMLSTYATLEPFTKAPRVLDVDDALWVLRGGGFARRLAEACDHVICGNNFLAENFSRWNPRVSVLPTAVDTGRFAPAEDSGSGSAAPGVNPFITSEVTPGVKPVIGWIGLSSGFPYLGEIEAALAAALRRHPECVLRIISDRPPQLPLLPPRQLEYRPYAGAREVADIQAMTVGIMPLDGSVWARGKCSFKMIRYMACGVPVVVSPYGMNAEILQQGEVGFGATSAREWTETLEALLASPNLRAHMGRAGRAIAERHYSLAALAPRLANILRAQVCD